MATKADIRRWASIAGLDLDIYSPGDGKSRYTFAQPDPQNPNHRLRTFRTCVGLASAETFLDGYLAAMAVAKVQVA